MHNLTYKINNLYSVILVIIFFLITIKIKYKLLMNILDKLIKKYENKKLYTKFTYHCPT